MRNTYKFITTALLLSSLGGATHAQQFDKEQYQKALWMTARFYGAQRSGAGHSWLIAEHEPTKASSEITPYLGSFVKGQDFVKDADGDYDLTGGWFDCGDHVKFGQTEFFAGYMLALGYSEFPGGYEDFYSQNYEGYIAASNYTWEGKAGKPNGIPDILDEVKYATDYFMKCIRNEGIFYYQVGNGDDDHKIWCTSSVKAVLPRSLGGEREGSRPVKKATGGTTSMTALCGATLASMARSYKPFDPIYANKCLEKAKTAYEYVDKTAKSNADGGGYYPAKDKFEPDIVILCMELYRTTGDETYLAEAKKYSGWMAQKSGYNHNFSLCYNNTEDLACYLMAMYGSGTEQSNAKTALSFLANMYLPTSGHLMNVKNDGWGILRFPANQSFVRGLYAKMCGDLDKVDPYALASIEYIMGGNGKKFSYIVGFGDKYPHYPHHRNFYGLDNNSEANLSNQEKFMQLGYMVGGSLKDGEYTDDEKQYTFSEGGIDYNAGLVSALGYINSILNPVNTNKFGHPTPELGEDKSICGLESITLDSKVPADGKKTFTWLLDGTQVEKSANASTYKATKAGSYTCVIDSAGIWQTEGKVEILADLPSPDIQRMVELCDPAFFEFDATVDANVTYQWSKDGDIIANETGSKLTVRQAGSYQVAISATGCSSKKAASTVTSKLPKVSDAVSTSDGTVVLKVEDDGDYEWYDAAEDGNLLGTGSTYTTKISKNSTFYVQNAGSSSFVAGPEKSSFSGEALNWGNISVLFKVKKPVLINGFDVLIKDVYTVGSQTISFVLEGNSKGEFVSDAINISKAGWYTVQLSKPIELEAGSYSMYAKPSSSSVAFYDKGPQYGTYKNMGDAIEITGVSNGESSNGAMTAIANWQIQAGSGCGRAIVYAKYEQGAGITEATSNYNCKLYPNPAYGELNIEIAEEGEAKVQILNAAGQIITTAVLNGPVNVSNLVKGIYTVRVITNNGVYINQFIKE